MAINQMPHSLDAEAALLGCIIIDGDIQSELLEELKEDDFYQDSHKEIITAMKAVYGSRMPVDLITLTDRLDKDGKLERAGGLSYITELAQMMPSSAHYKQYFEIIRRDSVNRSLIRASRDIIENSMKGEDERDAVAFAEKRVFDISKRGTGGKDLVGMADGELIGEVIGKFENIQSDPNAFRGLETGFRRLDRITNGLQKSDFIVLAARPGVGKSSFAMNIVEHACLRKNCVAAVFSLEMPRTQLVQRTLCSYADVSMEKALSGKLQQSDWKNLMRASDKMQKSRLYIDDSSRITPQEITSKCRRLKSKEGRLDIIMIDYIQLMGSADKKSGGADNRQQEIANITRELKIMAKELDVPVLALSQLRRIQTQEAQLSDLRESGAIEQDADIVMFINRPEMTGASDKKENLVKGASELVIAKHRNGSTGRIQLRFIGECTRFVEVDSQGEPNEEPDYMCKKQPDFEENPPLEETFPQDIPPEEDVGLPFD